MGFNVVRQSLPVAFLSLLLFVTAGLVRVGGSLPCTVSDFPLPGDLLVRLQTAQPLLTRLLCGVGLFWGALLLGRATVRCALYPVHTYLAIPLYGLCSCGLLADGAFVIQCVASLLLLFAVRNFYASFHNGYRFQQLFRGAFCLGLLPLVYAPALPLVALLPVALLLFKRSAREGCVALFGLVLPLFACSYAGWAAGQPFDSCVRALGEAFMRPSGWSLAQPMPVTFALFGLLLFLALWAVFDSLRHLHGFGARPRAVYLFNWLLLPGVVALCFLPSATEAVAGLFAVPAAVLVPLSLTRLPAPVSGLLYVGLFVGWVIRLFA